MPTPRLGERLPLVNWLTTAPGVGVDHVVTMAGRGSFAEEAKAHQFYAESLALLRLENGAPREIMVRLELHEKTETGLERSVGGIEVVSVEGKSFFETKGVAGADVRRVPLPGP